jgi:hypothetical protein
MERKGPNRRVPEKGLSIRSVLEISMLPGFILDLSSISTTIYVWGSGNAVLCDHHSANNMNICETW